MGDFITFGEAFIDHLNGQGYKFEKEDGDSIVSNSDGMFLLVPSIKTCQRSSPTYAACNGISLSQVRIFLQSLKRNNCLRVSNHFVESYFASPQYDGVGLKPA